jgi:hypothetical protein
MSDASMTANVVNHAAHAASGAPFTQGTVVEDGSVVVVVPVTPSESALGDAEELLHADNTAKARMKATRDLRVKLFMNSCSPLRISQDKYARRT